MTRPGMRLVKTRADLVIDGKTGLLFGMRYVPDGMTLKRTQKLFDCGVRVMSLAYEDIRTQYGDGSGGRGELTQKGEELLEWMNACGILLDLSGTGNTTAMDALEFIQEKKLSMQPMASHSGCYWVSKSKRDLPDTLLETIVKMDGYVGIPYLNPNSFVQHADHALRKMGTGKIGIGSDSSYFRLAAGLGKRIDSGISGENFRKYLYRALSEK